jgi:hypothetical protein
MKLKPLQVKAAGEHYVTAEIHRRGAYGSPFAGNVPHWDIVAMDAEHKRHIDIQVKTKNHPGRWAASTRDGRLHPEPRVDEHQFWVLVDLSKDAPEYYVVPAWWMEHHIFTAYEAYLAKRGGTRPGKNPKSTDWSILPHEVEQWRDRWDVLGIFPDGSAGVQIPTT